MLGDGGEKKAVAEWSSIQTMEETWALEPENIFEFEPHATDWQRIQRSAAQMVGEAMLCHSTGGALRTKNPKQREDIESWHCNR